MKDTSLFVLLAVLLFIFVFGIGLIAILGANDDIALNYDPPMTLPIVTDAPEACSHDVIQPVCAKCDRVVATGDAQDGYLYATIGDDGEPNRIFLEMIDEPNEPNRIDSLEARIVELEKGVFVFDDFSAEPWDINDSVSITAEIQ